MKFEDFDLDLSKVFRESGISPMSHECDDGTNGSSDATGGSCLGGLTYAGRASGCCSKFKTCTSYTC